jgi:hypothetical protein
MRPPDAPCFFDAEGTHQIAQYLLIRVDLSFELGEEDTEGLAFV